jgi:hypothetical protein
VEPEWNSSGNFEWELKGAHTMTPRVASFAGSIAAVLALSTALAAAQPAETAGSGFLGVQLADEIPDAVLTHLGIDGGAMVLNVIGGSGAEKAGLKRHDVVIAVDDEKIASAAALRQAIARRESAATVKLKVSRGAETLDLSAQLGTREGAPPAEPPAPPRKPGFLGVHFDSVPASLAVHLRLEKDTGILLTDVLKDSPASSAGLEKYDVVLKVAGETVTAKHREHADAWWPYDGRTREWFRDAPVADAGALGGGYSLGGGYFFFAGPAPETNFPALISGRSAGDEVALEVFHRGERKEVKVRLGEALAPLRPRLEVFPSPQGSEFHRPNHRIFGKPRASVQGKIRWRDADGKEHEFEIPALGDELRAAVFEELRNQLDRHKLPDGVFDEFKKAFKDLDTELDFDFDFTPKAPFGAVPDGASEVYSSSSRVSAVSASDGTYEITVRDENGRKTFSAKKDGRVLAEDLDWEKLSTLPEDVQRKVEEIARGLESGAFGEGLPIIEVERRGGEAAPKPVPPPTPKIDEAQRDRLIRV